MIQMIRIDDRLLHGQVAYSWKAKLSYEAAVVVSEAAAKDELRRQALRMCCPDGVKLATRGIAEAAALLQNEKLKDMKVLVIASDPQTVKALLAGITERPKINIGGMQKKDHTMMLAKAVYVSEEDLQCLDELAAQGYDIEVQMVPETSMHPYPELRKSCREREEIQ
jgi:fructoselysine and glucoselysine-specific PTS system IIB component